jgi:hypothetical protein
VSDVETSRSKNLTPLMLILVQENVMNTDLQKGLVEVPGELPTSASRGLEVRADSFGRRAAASYGYLTRVLDLRPEAQVLVLDEADWGSRNGTVPYGLPGPNYAWFQFRPQLAAADL